MTAKKALVRRPGPRLAEGLLTHLERQPVDLHLALDQWAAYVEVMARTGWEIVEVSPADDCPDAAFVEDTMVVYGDLAVISRPGAEERWTEIPGAADDDGAAVEDGVGATAATDVAWFCARAQPARLGARPVRRRRAISPGRRGTPRRR